VTQEALSRLESSGRKYDAVLVDEGQDFTPEMFKVVAGLLNTATNNLTIALDDNQNIYRPKAQWKGLGIQARGRVHKLPGVYRNTAEIAGFASRFIGGQAPPVDLEHEARLQRFLVASAEARLLRSAHDCSEGGLAVALAESAIGGPYADRGFGAIADLRTYAPGLAPEQVLYGEDHGRVVLSVAPPALPGLRALLVRHGLRGYLAGEVRAPGGMLEVVMPGTVHRWPVDRLRTVYDDAIPRRMREVVSDRAGA